MTVKMGAPMPPNPMMPRQPMNPLPPPMPVPPIVPPQAAGTFPVNKDRRKRFGDSLENMLSRPPMVASDQMANMNVFTGQMMNTTARPPVVRMRGGGNVGDMYRQAYSSPAFKAAQSAASRRNPGRTGAMTHSDLMSKIRGGSSPNDDKPAPVAVTRDDDYTPTAAELNQQLLDIGAPDKRFDVVPNAIKKIYGGMGDLDARDDQTSTLNAINASIAAANRRAAGGFSDVEMAPGTGGIAAIRSRQPAPDELTFDPFNNTPSIPSGTSSTLAQNMITFPQSPDTSMQPGPAYSPSPFPDELVTQPFNNANVTPTYLPDELITEPFNSANVTPVSLPDELTGVPFNNLGLGDPNATQVGSGRGDPSTIPTSGGQTGTGSGEKDDRTIVQKIIDDFAAVPGNIARDIRMGIDAGFYTDFEVARDRLLKKGYDPKEVQSWIDRTKATVERNKQQTQGQSTDDDSPMSTSPVDPCPPGFKLDPVSGICVPIEEAEEEGPSLDLNRTRDDEFSELDDLMGKIVKPVGDTDEVRTMQAGGSVGLNRAADNFLAAMGA